jgi:hypothetical protein
LVVAGVALLLAPQLGRGGPSPSAAPPASTPETGQDATTNTTALVPAATSTTNSPTSSSTSTTISAAEAQRRLDSVDRLEQTQPITQHLPHDAPHFRVDYRVGANDALSLQVTLRAILNRPDQLEAYRGDLRAYKAEALDWLRSQGAEPKAYRIEWLPPEAAAL